ncbi:ketohexokinase-like isoform X2 [Pomacea canaliculata]|nr:ketohexokinase-like isoform X2 [Pomacea canaliculata]
MATRGSCLIPVTGSHGDETNSTNVGIQQPVLCVGLTVVDMVTVAEAYPSEDSDQRAVRFYKQRGGNASNTCTVLSHLGTKCEYLGVLPDSSSPEHSWLIQDFMSLGVAIKGCVFSDKPCPVATVVVSQQTGSRTILFCAKRCCVQWSTRTVKDQFVKAVSDRLHEFSWIHFELRPNVDDYLQMMEKVRATQAALMTHGSDSASQTVSVEIEKPELDRLVAQHAMSLADVVFFSKDWARSQGWTDMHMAVKEAGRMCPQNTTVVCPWGDEGAAAWHKDDVITVQAVLPEKVVDTLGAGDTFIGGFLHARTMGLPLEETMRFACHVAGYKCGIEGYQGLKTFYHLLS